MSNLIEATEAEIERITKQKLLNLGMTEAELKDFGYVDDVADYIDRGACFYDSVEALGEADRDNDCRDPEESDEEFGWFLVDTPGCGLFLLSSGRVMVTYP